MFAVFFFLIFSILGVSLWDGMDHFRCRETAEPVNGDWIAIASDDGVCGARKCEVGTCGSLVKQMDSDSSSLSSVSDVYRDTKIDSIQYGLINFDHVPNAFLTIFQCITLEGWTTIMYKYQDAYGRVIPVIYFVLVVLICSYFVLNLTVAIMLDNYEKMGESDDNDDMMAELTDHGREAGLPDELTLFLVENDIDVAKSQKKVKKLCSNLFFFKLPKSYYKMNSCRKILFLVVSHPIFSGFIFLSILINTITLMFDRYPESTNKSLNSTLEVMNYVFMFIFTLEVVLKIIGLGLKDYCKDRFNLFDTLVVVLSIAEAALAETIGNG